MRKLLSLSSIACLMTFAQAQTPATGNRNNDSNSANNPATSSTGARTSSQSANTGSGMQNQKAKGSDAVTQMLSKIDDARKAISNNNKQQAQHHLSEALTAADRLGAGCGQQVVPLYSEISQYSALGPIEAAKSQSNATVSRARRTDTTDNSNAQQDQQSPSSSKHFSNQNSSKMQENVAIRQVVGQYTFVGLDAKLAKTHLQAAKDALNKGDMQAADQALAAVQNAVVMEYVAADMPLVKARENLMLARSAADKGDYRQAQSALQAEAHTQTMHAGCDLRMTRTISRSSRITARLVPKSSHGGARQRTGLQDRAPAFRGLAITRTARVTRQAIRPVLRTQIPNGSRRTG